MTILSLLLEAMPIALLAGVVGLDVVSFAQTMISRPIVAATLGGAFVGAPVPGLICGAALECLALEALPVGASRYNEWGSASVVAGAVAAGGAPGGVFPNTSALGVAVLVGITTAWFGGWTMIKHRQLIARFARPRLPQLAAGERRTVVGLQLFGLTADLGRGMLIGAGSFLIASPLALLMSRRFTFRDDIARTAIVAAVAAVAAAAVWKDFHAISGTRRLFLASLAVGTLAVLTMAR
jgi:PTS system mannose-specific IIC component